MDAKEGTVMSRISHTQNAVNTPHTEKLTAAAWAVLDVLGYQMGQAHAKGRAVWTYLGRLKLAKRLGLTVRTVTRALNRLVTLGYLRRGVQQCVRWGQWGGMPILPGPMIWNRIRKEAWAIKQRLKSERKARRDRGTFSSPFPTFTYKGVKKMKKKGENGVWKPKPAAISGLIGRPIAELERMTERFRT